MISNSKPIKSKLPPAPPDELSPLEEELLDEDDEELLELEELEELLELEDELLELDDDEEELLELDELLEDELEEPVPPPNTVARFEVALMPLAPLINIFPQLERLAGLKLLTISSAVQQPPLPDQDQPI